MGRSLQHVKDDRSQPRSIPRCFVAAGVREKWVPMPYKLMLQIDATETPPGWQAQWSRADRPIGEPITVQDQAARSMADLSRRFLELFEQDGRPLVDSEALRAIGRGLFATWFEPAWSAIAADGDGPGPRDLIVSSADRRVLNLPAYSITRRGSRGPLSPANNLCVRPQGEGDSEAMNHPLL
jgi:hypothetical protein